MSSLPPQIFPFRLKKPRSQPQKRNFTNIPAVEELRQSRKKWRKDRADLFTIYGENFHDFFFLGRFIAEIRFRVFVLNVFRAAFMIWSTK